MFLKDMKLLLKSKWGLKLSFQKAIKEKKKQKEDTLDIVEESIWFKFELCNCTNKYHYNSGVQRFSKYHQDSFSYFSSHLPYDIDFLNFFLY